MKKIKIDDKSYDVPELFEEVSLGQLQDILALNKDLPDYEYIVKKIAIVLKCDESVTRKIDGNSLIKINMMCTWLGDITASVSQAFDGATADKDGDLVFNIDGQLYTYDHTFRIIMGQEIDSSQIMQSDDASFYQNLHRLMAIILKPAKQKSRWKRFIQKSVILSALKKKKLSAKGIPIDNIIRYEVSEYDASTVNTRAELFKNRLSAKDAMRCGFFLSNLKGR